MTTRSNDEERREDLATSAEPEKRLIDKGTLRKVFWRAFLLPSCYSMDRMQAPGFCYSIMPVLRKLYGSDKQEFTDAMVRHQEVYNNTYACSPFVLGITAAMEEQAANDKTFDVSAINNIKVALMGPLSGIGDTFFWGTFRIIASGVGISLASQGSILGPLIFLIIYNIPHILVRVFGLKYGYKLGSSSIDALVKGGLMAKATLAATVLGLVVVGGMIASMVTVNVAFVADFGSGMTLSVQEVLDQLCPCLLPLVLTFIMWRAWSFPKSLPTKSSPPYWPCTGLRISTRPWIRQNGWWQTAATAIPLPCISIRPRRKKSPLMRTG